MAKSKKPRPVDDGKTVEEVYGDLQKLQEEVSTTRDLINKRLRDVPAGTDVSEFVRKVMQEQQLDADLIEVDLDAPTYAGAHGAFTLELVVDDVDDVEDDAGVSFEQALTRIVVETHATNQSNAIGVARPPRVERTSIGGVVVGRVRFSPGEVASLAEADALVAQLPEKWRHAVEPLHHLAFDPGKISFKPGRISFKPGKISFKPGLVLTSEGASATAESSVQPGEVPVRQVRDQQVVLSSERQGAPPKVRAKPAVILPQPAECPNKALNRILEERWKVAMGTQAKKNDVTVAILDTGINRQVLESHPLFAGQSIEDDLGASPDLDIEPEGSNVDEYFGHGTLVAGIVAQAAPLARINHEAIRNQGGFSDSFEVARDLPDISDAQIVVLSFATSAASAEERPVLCRVIKHLMDRDVLVVCANGATSDLLYDDDKLYPADFTREELYRDSRDDGYGCLLSVDAVDSTGAFMPGTRGNGDVRSRGVGVLSAFPHGHYRFGGDGPILPFSGWARVTGTSFAAPRVAGEFAARYIKSDGRRSPAALARKFLKDQAKAGKSRPFAVAAS